MLEPDRTLVSAADLPPAADRLAALFAEEPASTEEVHTEAPTHQFPDTTDSLEHAETFPEADESEIAENPERSARSTADPGEVEIGWEDNSPSTSDSSHGDLGMEAHRLAAADSGLDKQDALDSKNLAEAAPPDSFEVIDSIEDVEPRASNPETSSETKLETILEADSPTTPDESVREDSSTPASGAATAASDWAFEERLASHREWVESQGATGKKANWANLNLEDRELIGVNLRFADLHAANLKGADLLLADLRDTCLIRANLQESCLVGANLEGANLEGASLATSMGLVARQLAGTNLHDAALPAEILEFEALVEFERACRSAFHFFVALMSVSLLSALVIWRTKDAQLISDSGLISIPHFPAAAAALPTEEIYLIAPVLIFILYFSFHLHLQRLWTSMLELPAVFPDGRVLGQSAPRIVAGLLRAHFRWMNQQEAGVLQAEKMISLLLAYGIAPVVLLLYWARYLTLQDLQGTTLQAVLATAAAGMTLYALTRVGRPQEKWALGEKSKRRFAGRLKRINIAVLTGGFCILLLLLSVGTIKGIPREQSLAPQFMTFDIRRWGPSFLSLFGLDPYAKLPEAAISTAPEGWSGTDDQVSLVKGAMLNGRSLRYAEGYGIFLANAHLFRANLQGAFLSESDFRNADLGQGTLRLADLDRARMSHSNLNRADLNGANLARADLRNADLSYASLESASLVDAQLGGASFYEAHLPFAILVRANLEKSDLRDADLEGADLEHADVRQAYLWSAKLPRAHLRYAQLMGAILIAADLRGADLGGAQLSETVLNEANLSDTNLAGADLRGTLGLTANQVCSAKYRQGALLDDAMQAQVDAQCGPVH